MSDFEKLREIICSQFKVDEGEVTPETTLRDELGADSLDLVDLAMSIEDEFEIEVPDSALEKFNTVEDVVNYIEEA